MRRQSWAAASRLKAPSRHSTPLRTLTAPSPPIQHFTRPFTSARRLTSSPTTPSPYPFEFLEDVEDPLDYEPGGFHPISIGDTFRDGRYRVIHKLGFGGYSTVWLSRDEESGRYVAIKVSAADAPASEDENRVLAMLVEPRGSGLHPGRQYIPSLLDHFTVSGPNGQHACLVTSPARSSLRGAKDDYSWPTLCPVGFRAIAAQLIEAVAYMHSRGVVHGG